MKQIKIVSTCLKAVGLMAMVAAITANAATPSGPPALNGQLVLRPLTPGDVTIYKLPSTTENSGGLTTVGVGTPVYLEAEMNIAIPAANIVSVTWTLTNTPQFSTATLTSSPLGTNIPIYEPADRSVYQVASRMQLRPDLEGQYTVIASIVTTTNGTTNESKTITAATYMGVNTCAFCHSGGVAAPDKYTTWINTAHAHIFSEGINGELGTYRESCLKCHTAGYDLNTNAVNGGFDDAQKKYGWVFPTVQTSTNWAYMQAAYPNVATLGNIQCENCHGPGSQHVFTPAGGLGNTNFISKTINSGDCNQCHDAPTHHIYGTQWYVSGHANTTRTPSGPSRSACVRCHTSDGFVDRIDNLGSTNAYTTNTMYSAIGCQTCHEPHGETMPADNPHLLRVLGSVTMPDGSIVTNAGFGALCLQCHQVRNGSATNQLVKYPIGQNTWNGGSSFGVHDSSQGDMIEGINAHTYGQNIPSAAHRTAVTNLCVGCHMQAAPIGDPAYLQAGGHTFKMTYNVVTTNGSTLVTNLYDKVTICADCHGEIASFNMPRGDLNGDGVLEGVQTEVKHLLDKLSTMLPNSTWQSNGNYVADGVIKSSVSFKTNWPAKFLKAGYNWQFVANDGSLGVHNAPFAVGLLKASMADLTGDANHDGLADAWQVQYFGSATNVNAAPNASPAGDGVPNWLKYSLGLDPMVAGLQVPDGVVWASGKDVGNPSGTNTLHIYTAAEVAFDTEVGSSYYIQEVSSLSAGWKTIAGPIAGTGSQISYVTPTRKDVQQYFRVYHNP